MNAAALIPLPASAIPARLASAGATAWEVVTAGSLGAVELAVGDRVICEPCERDGAALLAPRGRGRAVLGARAGGRLSGPWGEPCHPGRWEAAGAPRWRLVADPWGRWTATALAGDQLPLFATAA